MEAYQILHDVKDKCSELTQKIDSLLKLLSMLETYFTYSNLMKDFESVNSVDTPPTAETTPKGAQAMNPQDMQQILSSMQNKDQSMSQAEFDTIFETLKQGKTKEEIDRMEQMVKMAKSFLK